MNNKRVSLMLSMIFLISLLSFGANAALGDIFRAGLTPIENFFSGGWQNYEKTVAFVVFFFLFFSAYLMGMKNSKVFGDKLTRAPMVFAFVAAFLSSLIVTVNIGLEWINLKYIAWFLMGVLVLFLIYSLLLKLGMEKHKFWAFLLALIIAALLLWLIWYLMNEGRPLGGVGRFSDWLGTLSSKAAGLKGEKAGEAKQELWPGGAAPKGRGETTTGGGGGKGGISNYWLLLLLPFLLLFSRRVRERIGIRGRREIPSGTPTPTREALIIPEEIMKLLEGVKNKKNEVLSKIRNIMKRIEGNETEIVYIYKKYLMNIRKNGRVPWLRSEGSPEFRAIKKDDKDVKKLIEEQKELEKLLIELSQLEKALVSRIETLRRTQMINMVSYNQSLDNLRKEVIAVLRNILVYYHIAVEGLDVENKLDELFDEKHLEDRIKDKWLKLVEIETADLIKYFNDEKTDLELLEKNIGIENLTIDEIEKLLKQEIVIESPKENSIHFTGGQIIGGLKVKIEGIDFDSVRWVICEDSGGTIGNLLQEVYLGDRKEAESTPLRPDLNPVRDWLIVEVKKGDEIVGRDALIVEIREGLDLQNVNTNNYFKNFMSGILNG